MGEEIEKVKRCALQVSKELNYDIDETIPIIKVSRSTLEKIQFSAFLDLSLRKFMLENPKKIEDPEVKILLDTLNRHLEKCLRK